MRRHALTLRPRYLFALLGGGTIAETDHGDESLEVFYSATHLHCWRGTVWHCCLGTCWHCCLGTCSHCCLGTCWHCCRGSSEHCCRGTVWHCCLDTGSQTWFKDIFHPGFQFFQPDESLVNSSALEIFDTAGSAPGIENQTKISPRKVP